MKILNGNNKNFEKRLDKMLNQRKKKNLFGLCVGKKYN